MTAPKDEKYIVFKREDFFQFLGEVSTFKPEKPASVFVDLANAASVEDAVVIRRQDVFAPPALDAYANAIQVAAEMALDVSNNAGEDVIRLRQIADYFHAQAVASWETERKLPD